MLKKINRICSKRFLNKKMVMKDKIGMITIIAVNNHVFAIKLFPELLKRYKP